MRIIDVREETASLRSEIRNAWIDFSEMTCSVVAVVTDLVRDGKPVIGYGFGSNGRYAAGGLLRERFLPRLKRADPDSLLGDDGYLDPFRAWDVMMHNEKPGGHGERSVAVGVVDMALWNALAKAHGVPLWRLLADRYNDGQVDETVWVYAAGGYYYDRDDASLIAEMRGYLDLGYDTVKMKIGGAELAEDRRRIELVLGLLGPGQELCVDANGRLDRGQALAYADMLKDYPIRWYEEAGDPLDFDLQREVCEAYAAPVATGENLFSMVDARNLIRYGGMRPDRDVLQFDCSLSYGLVEYTRILDMLAEHGWSNRRVVPHGGHQMSLNIAAGLGLGGNESYPGIFQPFGGFADGIEVIHSQVALPDAPGIGLELKGALFRSVLTPMTG